MVLTVAMRSEMTNCIGMDICSDMLYDVRNVDATRLLKLKDNLPNGQKPRLGIHKAFMTSKSMRCDHRQVVQGSIDAIVRNRSSIRPT